MERPVFERAPDDRTELIPSERQRLWGTPAVLNFALGGLGTGGYMLATLASGFAAGPAVHLASWLGPALVLTGFAAVAAEAGRPLRGPRVLARVRTSWMSRELILGGLFVVLALLEHVAPAAAWRVLATASAAALVAAQGAILRHARGVVAWDVSVMPAVFLVSAIVSGAGFLLVADAAAGVLASATALVVTSLVLVFAGVVWLIYLTWVQAPDFERATTPLRNGRVAIEIASLAYLGPFVLVTLGLAIPEWRAAVAPLAGVAMILGQARAKHALLCTVGLLRPIALRLPPCAARTEAGASLPKAYETPHGGTS